MLAADIRSFCLNLRLLELEASCRSENRATALDDVCHIDRLHLKDFLVEKSLVSAHDTLDFDLVGQSLTYDRTDRGIHTGGVAAARQHTDCIELFICFHKYLLCRSPGRCMSGIRRAVHRKKCAVSCQYLCLKKNT